MKIAISILSSLFFIFTSVMTLAIISSSHIITRPEGKAYHIVIIFFELIFYYLSFNFTKKLEQTKRDWIIILIIIAISFDSAWRMITFSYMFIDISFDIVPHFLLIDFIPLYLIIAITWVAGKNYNK